MNRRGFFNGLWRLAGGLAFTGWQVKGCTAPQPVHAEGFVTTLTAADASAPMTTMAYVGQSPVTMASGAMVGQSAAARGVLMSGGSLAELVDYAQDYGAEEYRAAYLRETRGEVYHRTVVAYRNNDVLSIARAAGCLREDGTVDYGTLSEWERAQFGTGYMHPSHPTMIRHEAAYRRFVLAHEPERTEFDDWYDGPGPGFVGGPAAQPIVSTERLGEALIVSGGKAAIVTCDHAPHLERLGVRLDRDYDIAVDPAPARYDAVDAETGIAIRLTGSRNRLHVKDGQLIDDRGRVWIGRVSF